MHIPICLFPRWYWFYPRASEIEPTFQYISSLGIRTRATFSPLLPRPHRISCLAQQKRELFNSPWGASLDLPRLIAQRTRLCRRGTIPILILFSRYIKVILLGIFMTAINRCFVDKNVRTDKRAFICKMFFFNMKNLSFVAFVTFLKNYTHLRWRFTRSSS